MIYQHRIACLNRHARAVIQAFLLRVGSQPAAEIADLQGLLFGGMALQQCGGSLGLFGGRMAGVEPADADIEFVPKSAPGRRDADAVLRATVRTDGSPCLADGKLIAALAAGNAGYIGFHSIAACKSGEGR